MLRDEFTTVMQVTTREQLHSEVVGFARRLGFDTVTAVVVIDSIVGEPKFISVDNTPEAYLPIAYDRERAHRDPVMQHCKRSSVPIIWGQDTYVLAGRGEDWEEQSHYGYRTGIIVAFHLPKGLHFCIGVDRDQPLPACKTEVTRMTAELQLFASLSQDAALRVLSPVSPQAGIPNLTPRELETLRWTMEGKTAWELGHILGISEQTAARHLNNATHKLDCVNKVQAVVKALRFGLIH